jgi:hypothetical protein
MWKWKGEKAYLTERTNRVEAMAASCVLPSDTARQVSSKQ